MSGRLSTLSPTFQDILQRVVREDHEAQQAVSAAVDWKDRHRLKRRAGKKHILPGYPRTVPFRDNEEARAYLAGAELTCLLCGKPYRLLPGHLRDTHGVEPDEYRAAYNIPYTFGLADKATRGRRSARLKEQLAVPAFLAVWLADSEIHRQEASRQSKNQRSLPFRKEIARKSLEKAGVVIGRWADADYLHLLELMKTRDVLLVDIAGKVDGTPSLASARKWFYSRPERHRLLVETVHQLSFRNQARGHMIGPRLIEAMRAMRRQGMLQREIANATGVCAMTVAKFIKDVVIEPEAV